MTYSGHPMSCAAGIAALQVYEEDGLLENARRMGAVMAEGLADLEARHPSIGEVRGLGLFWNIELVKDRQTREPLVPWNARGDELGPMPELAGHMRERSLYTFTKWNWIFVVPPLCITAEQIGEGLAVIDSALEIADASLDAE